MPSRRIRKSLALAEKSSQLALAVPQVVAQRAMRMALAGPNLSRRDRHELNRMTSEKTVAFMASWSAIALQIVQMQQAWTLSLMTSIWTPWLGRRIASASFANRMQDAAVAIALSGLAPVHRVATANAKRLRLAKRS